MRVRPVISTLTAVALVAATAAAFVVFGGLYDVSATKEHTRFVYSLMEQTMRSSVRSRAAGIEVPPLDGEALLAQGAACYREHCEQCHGGPGVAPAGIAQSMQPVPGTLIDAARRWRERELYWITRHGIKMSGMPAWEMRLSETQLWAVVGFVGRLPKWSPQDYAARVAGAPPCAASPGLPRPEGARTPREQGARALRQYACHGCHVIPGLSGSDTQVGPPLEGLSRRALIAGRLPNTEDNLVRWIRTPHGVKPGSAMPEMGVTQEHALLMAAYLKGL